MCILQQQQQLIDCNVGMHLRHSFACRRANKTLSEALAYYNMGVLHDNDKEYEKANRLCARMRFADLHVNFIDA